MGAARRHVPKHLASKLRAVREYLELTQEQMVERLVDELEGERVKVQQTQISAFERGTREPPLIVVMAYARIVHIPMEMLVDDEVSLPFEFELIMRRDMGEPTGGERRLFEKERKAFQARWKHVLKRLDSE